MSVIQPLDELYRSFSVLIANIAPMCTTVYIGVIYENNKLDDYRLCTERRSAFKTAIEFGLLSF